MQLVKQKLTEINVTDFKTILSHTPSYKLLSLSLSVVPGVCGEMFDKQTCVLYFMVNLAVYLVFSAVMPQTPASYR